jgi:tellurium resistance protein TerD
MTLELDRLAPSFARVVVGVAIHQNSGPKTFGDISNAGVLVVEGYKELLKGDFAQVAGSTAATVAEFARDTSGAWEFHGMVRGFDSDPVIFAAEMGSTP